MKKELSNAAQVAKIIRAELKKNSVKARVTSKNYSMGDSVNVEVNDLLPAVVKRIRDYCNLFRAGNFDGMTDMYTYNDKTGPTTKYIFVNCMYSDELKDKAWAFIRNYYTDAENAPINRHDASRVKVMGRQTNDFIYHCLANEGPFWTANKTRVTS